jgi:type II secretory pathway component PulC
MNQKTIFFMICTGLLGLLSLYADDAPTKRDGDYRYETYRVISQRNIFSRYRRPSVPIKPRMPVRKQSVVLKLYVLKGVAVNGPRKIAFIEEEISGESIQGHIGTELLNGKINDIRFGSVLFEQQGQTRRINIGDTFGKTESPAETPGESNTDSSTPQETPKDDTGDSDENDILKKMMERRKNELGT